MPRKETAVIDFDAHLYPTVPESDGNSTTKIDGILEEWQPPLLFDRFSEAGIDGTVLSQPHFIDHDDVEVSSIANDELLEMVTDHEELGPRVQGSRTLRYPDSCSPTNRHQPSSGCLRGRAGTGLGLRPRVGARCERLFGHSQGVLDGYTDLNLVFHHFGGNIEAMMGRIKHRLEVDWWPEQDRVKPFAEFKNQLEDRIYIDSASYLGYQDPINTAFRQFPDSQVLFGTNAPFDARDLRN